MRTPNNIFDNRERVYLLLWSKNIANMALPFLLFGLFTEPTLQIQLSNIREAKGYLYLAVYNRDEAFLKPDEVCAQKIVAVGQAGKMTVSLKNLPPGSYAVSCFHDLNGNGKLDTNLFGVPTEPYGFSNNARPRFRAPKWSEAVFELAHTGAAMNVRLEKW